MTDRLAQIAHFLASTGWDKAEMVPLAGDASNRRYYRLYHLDRSAVLMDAPPERGEDVRPFLDIGTHLMALGFSAPQIMAAEEAVGLLLLEDLGDALFARVLEKDIALENSLYSTAIDLLCALHEHAPPAHLPTYDPRLMTDLAALVFDWYLPAATGRPNESGRRAFCELLESLLVTASEETPVTILRDFHAENLVWLPERKGVARVGLLDFQDAMAGHPAYDLVSLLQDARRDVSQRLEEAMLTRYVATTGVHDRAFRYAYALLGAQRNLRIIGVFARLCLRDGKPSYLDLLPRVWEHLQTDLRHPALAPLRALLSDLLPPPTASIRDLIKEKCPKPLAP